MKILQQAGGQEGKTIKEHKENTQSAPAGNKTNLHAGHRDRLKKRFDAVGEKGFEDHTLLELLLFYGVPQKDTNPLAHRLLERFGSLPAVLEAPARELMQVEGVGENVARLLKVTQAMRCRCTQQQVSRQKVVLNSSLKAGEYLCSLLQGRETEALLLVCLDAGKAVRHCEQLESGVSDSISTTLRQIAQLCVNRNVHDIILAHNHPSGLVHPSREDIVMTRKAQDFLQEIGVNLLDHFVITDKEFYSMKDHRLF